MLTAIPVRHSICPLCDAVVDKTEEFWNRYADRVDEKMGREG